MSSLIVLQDVRTVTDSFGNKYLVDEEDFDRVGNLRWGRLKAKSGDVYALFRQWRSKDLPRRQFLMHRFLKGAKAGSLVDHKNGDTRDNRQCNLRICDRQENNQNRHRAYGVSRYKGVHWDKRSSRWTAKISVSRKRYERSFVEETDAARCYDEMALKFHGEFACTNRDIHGDY